LRLLFDQNLPHRFASSLADLFPKSLHVKSAGLASASDKAVWNFARDNGYAIISKDADFHQMSFLYGTPPKTIWLRCGNCSVNQLEQTIRNRFVDIRRFLDEDTGALLVVS
jgi:predicted nuclease of predicted toxin-antitoxin system